MSEIEVTEALVGRKVCNPARPEWGTGTVERVVRQSASAPPTFRVTIRFQSGQRVLLSPPARLTEPAAGVQRAAGWLDSLAGTTPDDRLRSLPDDAVNLLGSAHERFLAIAALYAGGAADLPLHRWATAQTGCPDPLSQWTRDELAAAHDAYTARRDALLRERYAVLRAKLTPSECAALLAELDEPARSRVRQSLGMG
ncbi:MAG: DUF3553 domain-containing protein [Planctomycetia bacterium]|nr:MAG: DUF3553 domain-containing protein [Planctomycetia bacterium]